LPAYTTPFDVWFGWAPYWLTERVLNVRNRPIASDSDADNKDNSDSENSNINKDTNSDTEYPPETDNEAEDYILTAIEQCIRANNTLVANKMVQKSKKKAVLFADSTLVTLAIPGKMRLSLEPKTHALLYH
jgi:hypothetical protein